MGQVHPLQELEGEAGLSLTTRGINGGLVHSWYMGEQVAQHLEVLELFIWR